VSRVIDSAVRRVLSNRRKPLLSPPTPGHLEAIRLHEIGAVIPLMPVQARILEIGAGTGWQARAVAQHGFEVESIDLPTSQYAGSRVWPARDYDGISIPSPPESFDVVFSSSTLEHIPRLRSLQTETRPVLRPGGVAEHIVPSAGWVLRTLLTNPRHYKTLSIVHGARAANCVGKMLAFRRSAWASLFSEADWVVRARESVDQFFTGDCIGDRRSTSPRRAQLSRWLGSSLNISAPRVATHAPSHAV
jgi:SAM-dependent methyltransferase